MTDTEQAKLPCKWGGGNDYVACMTCHIEYDYRKVPKPPCGAAKEIERLRKRVDELEELLRTALS